MRRCGGEYAWVVVKIAGFIKDYRQELESEVWLMPPLYHRVWQWLKYNVNHTEANVPLRDGTTVLVKPGERITSIRKIAEGVAWYERGILKEPNPRTIAEILKWLKNKKMIIVSNGESNRQYTLVSLINWDVYQEKDNKSNGESNAQSNSKTTVRQQSVHINKKEKNDKEKYIADFTSSFDLIEAINSFIEMRKKLKKEMTDNAVKLMLGKLKKLSLSESVQIDILNQSVMSSWTDIYPITQQKLFGNKPKSEEMQIF
jgi:hypothetical protein